MFTALSVLSNQALSLLHFKKDVQNRLQIPGAFANVKDYHLPIQSLTQKHTAQNSFPLLLGRYR